MPKPVCCVCDKVLDDNHTCPERVTKAYDAAMKVDRDDIEHETPVVSEQQRLYAGLKLLEKMRA